ncbi:MAG: collagen binding domain-containing protein [Bryobacteraceae bacterium]
MLAASALMGGCLLGDSIDGVVTEDGSGNAMSRAEVRVVAIGVGAVSDSLEADSKGRFHAGTLPTGAYRIEVSQPGHMPAVVQVHIPRQPTTPLRIPLVRLATIAGEVREANGLPISGARVHVLVKIPGGALRPLSRSVPGAVADSGEQGRYRLYDLPIGEYAIAAIPPGVLYPGAGDVPLTVAGGEEFDNINLSASAGPTYRITGTVELQSPGQRFSLSLTDASQPLLTLSTLFTGRDGGFSIAGVPSGSYDLRAAGPVMGRGPRGAIIAGIPLFGRIRVDVVAQDLAGVKVPLDAARSVAFALDSRTSGGAEPACPHGAKLTLTSLEDWGVPGYRSVQLAPGAPQVIRDLPPGRYYLSAAPGETACYLTIPPVIDLADHSPERPITVLVAEAGAIQGALSGTDRPTDFLVMLAACDGMDRDEPFHITYPDTNAHFGFDSLRPACYRLAVVAFSGSVRQAAWLQVNASSGRPMLVEIPAPQSEAAPEGGH